MTIKERMVGMITRAGYPVVRFLVLHQPDWLMGKILRLVERIVYIATGDRAATAPVAEVADIFESGPPFTTTIRKLMRAKEPELVESALRCLSRPSPYGAA